MGRADEPHAPGDTWVSERCPHQTFGWSSDEEHELRDADTVVGIIRERVN